MQKPRLPKRIKVVFFILVFVSSNQLWAAWGPDSEYFNEEATLIGTWVGAVNGKPFETAIWPNQSSDNLSGVMIWGACTARVTVITLATDSEKFNELKKSDANTPAHLLTITRTEIKTDKIQSDCSAISEAALYLAIDSKLENLLTYTESSANTLSKEQRSLQRDVPSRYLNEAIEHLTKSEAQYALTSLAKDAINNPARNYLTATKLFPSETLEDVENKYYVSEFGGIYQIAEINQGKPGQYFFYLKVVDLGPHNAKLNFSIGDNGGSGEFDSTTQTMTLSLFDQTEQCGQIRRPASEAKITLENLPPVSASTKNNALEQISWSLQSKGVCTSYQFYGECNAKACDRWFRDQVSNQNIKAIVTGSREVAEAQAKSNSALISRQ